MRLLNFLLDHKHELLNLYALLCVLIGALERPRGSRAQALWDLLGRVSVTTWRDAPGSVKLPGAAQPEHPVPEVPAELELVPSAQVQAEPPPAPPRVSPRVIGEYAGRELTQAEYDAIDHSRLTTADSQYLLARVRASAAAPAPQRPWDPCAREWTTWAEAVPQEVPHQDTLPQAGLPAVPPCREGLRHGR